ncbi:hypothetical protein JKP88DRAFT_327683 [Tribonema minus]|uniref:Glycosyltransferase subfamily 4-like N-terminal domain-containing protein n=1 Tax=Tribonema minus TaxID=303371 RepID=A0A835YPI7_9STRA|nr:hypothetical protein JKP88DRAFT_327683 [Tribonema minus]
MRVAIYSHSIPPAVDGVSRRFTSIISELHKAGHEVLVFTLEKEPQLEATLFPGSKRRPMFKYVHLESTFHDLYPSKRIAAPTLGNLWHIGHALAQVRPDVIHCTADAITLQFGLAGKALGIPVVTSIHTDVQLGLAAVGAPSLALYLTNLKERMESCLLDSCATTSESFKTKLLKQGVACDYVVKTAVQVDKFNPGRRCAKTRAQLTFNDPDAFLIVYVGRLAPEKGLDTLVTMARSVDRCYLAVIGDGPLGPHLAAQHGAANRLYCRPGFLDHDALPAVYASADAHATASVFETLGNTVLEAHACGVPVVAPRAQGFVDTVSHGVDGLLFDAAGLGAVGAAASGARALAALRDDPALRARLGAAGRAKVLLHAPDQVARDIVQWYGAAAARGARAGPLTAAVRASQLFAAVLMVLIGWHVYALPAALARAVGELLKGLRSVIASSPLARSIRASYGTLAGPVPIGGGGDCGGGERGGAGPLVRGKGQRQG